MIAPDHAFAERILSLVPINSLDRRLQEQALAQGEILEFRKKKTVFEMGARDPWTFYLLEGELELQAKESSPVRMSPGDENARRALAQLQPRRYTAVAMTKVSVFRIERAVLDHILADEQMLEEASDEMDVRELEDDEDDDADWMSRLLSSELFTRLPHENIQRFFTELEPLEAQKDDVVVEQGTPGDFLYIVAEGRCQVVRRAPGGGQETMLATLKEGDSFGEESLISNSPRNASIRMATDGMLMRLPKAKFEELVSNPTLKAVPWSEASSLAQDGALWVDVRFADEHQADGIEGSINAPLNSLRQQVSSFDRDGRYIVYCDSGARSSAAAFLMARLGFDTCYLAGGLERSPHGADKATPPAATPVASESVEVGELAAAANAALAFEFVSADEPQDSTEDTTEDAAGDDSAEIAQASSPEPTQPAAAEPVADPQSAHAAEETAKDIAAAPAAAIADTGEHPQMAKARAALSALKLERDKATAYGKKAADAARELKRRNEELNKRLQSERERREQLDKEVTAARADADRQASMEQSRLSGELDKAVKRIAALGAERDQAQEKAAADLAKLQSLVDEAQARLAEAVKDKEEAEATRVAAEVAFQDSLQAAQSEAQEAASRAQGFEQELAQARERLGALESRDQESAQQQLAETSEIKMDLALAQTRLEEERGQLEQERQQLNKDLEQLRKERADAEEQVRAERAALEKDATTAQSRNDLLDQREVELNDARNAVDGQLQQRDQELADRESALAEREQALSDEKAAWQQTVDKAIADERERLNAEQARLREEHEALNEQSVQSQIEERVAELQAEHEAHETQMRGQVEAHVAKLLAEFDTRLETVRHGYETRLSEQEAMLEDERRRLEAEIVRLREALTDARQAPPVAAVPATAPEAAEEIPLPEPQAQDASALGFELSESVAAKLQEEQSTVDPTPAGIGTDLELDLEDDETELQAEARAASDAEQAKAGIPQIEMPEPDEPEGDAPDKPNEKRDRVISTDQLADIRARMQEKMRAAKSRAG